MRNLKRALSLAMASVMLFGMMVVGSSAASYPDVDVEDNLEAIEVLKMVGIMKGDEKGNFNPDKMVTRNEMAAVMVNLLGLTPGGVSPFYDVPEWAKGYVAACYNNGIIAGVSATEFNGDANVTAVQAGLMVMKALGYFGYQGEFGDSWKLATVKQADEIDLYRGVNAYTDQDMSRNDVAQMVLNALECTVMVVREQGGLNVEGNGITVNQRPTYEKTPAENREGYDYANTAAIGTPGATGRYETLQLCEKLYGKDLKKDPNGGSDDFGRTSTVWTYKINTIVSPNTPDLTYTEAVEIKDIFKDLGKPGTLDGNAFQFVDAADSANTYTQDSVDGKTKSIVTPYNECDAELGGHGATVQVYYDRTANHARLVEINTYVGVVSKVVKNDDDKYDVTVTLKTGSAPANLTDRTIEVETNDYAKDDVVLLTAAGGTDVNALKSIAPAEKVTGEVTAIKKNQSGGETYVKIDGTEYNATTRYYNLDASDTSYPNVGDELTAYVADGNLFAIDEIETSRDFLYVIDVIDAIDGLQAKVAFDDGSQSKIDIVKVDSTKGKALTTSNVDAGVFTYTEDGGEYTLKSISGTRTLKSNTDGDGAIKRGSAKITDVDSNGTNWTAGNKTIFVDVENKVAYTGFKEVPSFASVSMYAVNNTDDNLAEIVFITAGVDTTDNDLIFFVKGDKFVETKDGNTIYRQYTVYVNGEEQTLTTKNMTATADVSGDDDSTLKKGVIYVAKSVDSDGNLTAFDTTKSVDLSSHYTSTGNSQGGVITAKDGVLEVQAGTYDKTGKSNTKFTYNDEKTVFMIVEGNKDDDGIASVYPGDNGNIVVRGDFDTGVQEESFAYVMSVEDKDDETPLATLVVVFVPHA